MDPKEELEEEFKEKYCKGLDQLLKECTDRVNNDSSGKHETCVQELYDLSHCVDKYVI